MWSLTLWGVPSKEPSSCRLRTGACSLVHVESWKFKRYPWGRIQRPIRRPRRSPTGPIYSGVRRSFSKPLIDSQSVKPRTELQGRQLLPQERPPCVPKGEILRHTLGSVAECAFLFDTYNITNLQRAAFRSAAVALQQYTRAT